MSGNSSSETLLVLIKNVNNISGVEDCTKFRMYLRQCIISVTFFLIIIVSGMINGYTATLLQQLQPDNSNYSLKIENGEIFKQPEILVSSVNMQSWIASIMVLFMCPGCWILAICSKKVGRKPILFNVIILLVISWFIMAFANNVHYILISRSLSGLCLGIVTGLVAVYQGECSVPKLRAVVNASLAISFSVGVLVSHALGTWFHWRTTAIICGLFTTFSLPAIYYVPESPVWLLNKNKLQKAIYSWTFLRGIRNLDEFQSMHTKQSRMITVKQENEEDYNEVTRNQFCAPTLYKPLLIIIALFTVNQLSGIGAVTFYCIQMIADIAGPSDAYIPTLILDTFRLLAAIALVVCTKRFGTRKLVLFSTFSSSFCLIMLTISIFFEIWKPWLSLLLLFVYEASVIMGLGPLPWTFCSEILPISFKELGIGIVTSYNFILFFVIVKVNPYLFLLCKPWGTFFIYGIFTFLGGILFYFILPSTKNKSLKDIELMFAKSKGKGNEFR